jgi:hypothetical protein
VHIITFGSVIAFFPFREREMVEDEGPGRALPRVAPARGRARAAEWTPRDCGQRRHRNRKRLPFGCIGTSSIH